MNQSEITVMERSRFSEVTLCQQSLFDGTVVDEAVFLHRKNMQPERDSILMAPDKSGPGSTLLKVPPFD
jgi:hypothetical protein